jgi:para-aminobenzoate synthetase component 1
MTVKMAAQTVKGIICKLHYKKIRTPTNFSALNEIFAQLESASILGANKASADAAKFSYWAGLPKDVFEFRTGQQNPFEKLQQALNKYRLGKNRQSYLPEGIFCGGWIGYFSYELGRYIEPLPQRTLDDLGMPLIRLRFYDRLICYDHTAGYFWLIALQLPNEIERPEDKLAGLEQLLAKSREISVTLPAQADFDGIDLSQIRCNMDKNYYLRTVEKIRGYIYDGFVYQVNFSQRFECDYNIRPIELFNWQNHHNPSGYAAYIDDGDLHIVSASPEMFITITDGVISTKPIKGTRPRRGETNLQAKQINEKNFNELFRSEKEQAELNMIIDLERNDLTKICKYGTIKVVQPRTIEAYPTVFHAVATVEGHLRRKITFSDVLKSVFPGGSITGAPKISSMAIIEKLEPTSRGVYTGSIGFVGIDGNACLNIAIRTIIIKANKAFVQAGGAIVADSVAQAEWEETITKARALLAGINSVQRVAYSG